MEEPKLSHLLYGSFEKKLGVDEKNEKEDDESMMPFFLRKEYIEAYESSDEDIEAYESSDEEEEKRKKEKEEKRKKEEEEKRKKEEEKKIEIEEEEKIEIEEEEKRKKNEEERRKNREYQKRFREKRKSQNEYTYIQNFIELHSNEIFAILRKSYIIKPRKKTK